MRETLKRFVAWMEAANEFVRSLGVSWIAGQTRGVSLSLSTLCTPPKSHTLYGDASMSMCYMSKVLRKNTKHIQQSLYLFKQLGRTEDQALAIVMQIINGRLKEDDINDIVKIFYDHEQFTLHENEPAIQQALKNVIAKRLDPIVLDSYDFDLGDGLVLEHATRRVEKVQQLATDVLVTTAETRMVDDSAKLISGEELTRSNRATDDLLKVPAPTKTADKPKKQLRKHAEKKVALLV